MSQKEKKIAAQENVALLKGKEAKNNVIAKKS